MEKILKKNVSIHLKGIFNKKGGGKNAGGSLVTYKAKSKQFLESISSYDCQPLSVFTEKI